MLVIRVDKETPDITRIVVDMAWWLDPNEHITQIVSAEVIEGMSGWSEAPYPPPDSPPPYDPTPLILNSVALDATQRLLIMFVEFGTAGLAYTVQFIVDGTSARRVTFEVGVQITGVPPEQPMPLPPPPLGPGINPLDWYLPLKGGKMEGPLYLFRNPRYPTEAVTKHYVDGMSWVSGPYMPEAGGEFTGPVSMGESTLTLAPDGPWEPLDAASKQYVDGLIGTMTLPYLPLSGGTMGGLLTLAVEPLDPMDAATKGYVDTQIGGENIVISVNGRTGAIVLHEQDISDAGGALLDSPTFFGTPHAPTALPGTKTTQLATTEFVDAAVVLSTTGVTSFNTRTGAVALTLIDVTSVGGAPLANPTFTGNPSAPTPPPGDNDTSIATTAFVTSAIVANTTANVTSFNTRQGAVVLTSADVAAVGAAPLASPVFTGDPRAPTPLLGDNDTSIATTAFVQGVVGSLALGFVTSFNTRTGAITFTAADLTSVGGALLASPVFTGNPQAPTPSAGDNDTTIATTAFVTSAVAAVSTGAYLPLTGGTLAGPGNLTAQGFVKAQLVTAEMANGYPQYIFSNTAGGTNAKQASIYMGPDGNITGQFIDDSGTVGNAFLQASRSGASVATLALSAPNIYLNGASQISGGAVVLGAMQVNGVFNGRGNIISVGGGNNFLGSHHEGSSCVGFWNAANVFYFGNADGNGIVQPNPRVTIDTASNVWVNNGGALTAGYVRSTGTVQADGSVNANGNVSGSTISCAGRATLNDIMCSSGVFRVANNDNYYMNRGTDGTWNWVEGGIINMSVDASGSISARNVITAGTNCNAVGGQMVMGYGGNGRVLQFSPSWYIDWNISSGTFSFMHPSFAAGTWIVYADGRCFNNVADVGGHGPYVDYSDERAKHGIGSTGVGLAEVLKIKPIRFRRIGDQFKDREEIGFSAQQLRSVIPEAVTEFPFTLPDDAGDDPALGMVTTPIVAALVNAVKELQEQIHQLRKHK
jgi:hypothetical protein